MIDSWLVGIWLAGWTGGLVDWLVDWDEGCVR